MHMRSKEKCRRSHRESLEALLWWVAGEHELLLISLLRTHWSNRIPSIEVYGYASRNTDLGQDGKIILASRQLGISCPSPSLNFRMTSPYDLCAICEKTKEM